MRLATVGTSRITAYFLNALNDVEGIECTHVYSRSPEKAKAFAETVGVKGTISNWDELLNHPEIDIVYIASPNSEHFKQAMDVVSHGKHAIVEKPFVSHSDEFKRLMKKADEMGVYCFDALINNHVPNLKHLQKQVKTLGPIHLFNASMVQYSSRYPALLNGEEPNIFSLNYSGGALMDLGVYPLAVAISLFGEPTAVSYECLKHENGIDLAGTIVLHYPELLAVCTVAKNAPGESFTLISGEKAYLKSEYSPSILKSLTRFENGQAENVGEEQRPNSMFYEIEAFVRIIENKDDESYHHLREKTEILIRTLDKARASAGIVFKADSVHRI